MRGLSDRRRNILSISLKYSGKYTLNRRGISALACVLEVVSLRISITAHGGPLQKMHGSEGVTVIIVGLVR